MKRFVGRISLVEVSGSWSAVTILADSRYLIILNSKHKKSRQSNTLTHEISHVLLDHKPARVGISEEGLLLNTYDKKQEREADWLAGTILLPREALVLIRRTYRDLRLAARKYAVSPKLLEYRLNVTGVNYQYNRARKRYKT